jgi:hypothetical protein
LDEGLPQQVTPKRALSCPVLLACATAIGILSLFSHGIVSATPLVVWIEDGYVPLVLGGLSMLLCFVARQRTRHKRLVVAYAVLLAPFAFSYPAWMLFLWVMCASGKLAGPWP